MFRRIAAVFCALMMCLSLVPEANAAKAKTLTVSFQVTTYQNRARALLKEINQYRKANLSFINTHKLDTFPEWLA